MKMLTLNKKILASGLVFGGAVLPMIGGVASVSGLTYQNSTDVSFTFNPTLTVSVSDDLIISDLAPGTFADSNTVQVTVSTNNAYGYTLSATVGDTENNLSSELRHSTYASSGDPIFSSIATDADLARATFSSDTTYDNKWGLSTSNDGSTWGNYNGLPITGGESALELLSSDYTPTNGTASKYVRIGARASSTQSSGTYTNKINFIAVGGVEPEPPIYMQDVATWGSTLNIGDEITATDVRDGKKYTVAKLADGNIWMTQNLDHDIGDIAGGTYTSADTDISANWTPSTATYATGTTTWNGSYTAPESYDPGDLCWNGTIRSDYNGTISTDTVACGNDRHYHIGNYYNWTAAVAMNDSSSYITDNTDVNQSICPAGWRLPIGGTTNTGSRSFQYLVNQLSLTSGTSGNIQNSPVYFVYGGDWYGSSRYVGGYGVYWSSVVGSSDYAYYLCFDRTGHLYPQYNTSRDFGYSVRCVAR